MPKPLYRTKIHNVIQIEGGDYVLYMTIEKPHVASGMPEGTKGYSSELLSIDFERGIAITKNSLYLFE